MKIAHLVVVSGAKPAEYQIKLPSVLGRGRSANLTVPDPMVSRLHCKLFAKQGRLAIRDLGSLNGTYVNHKRISRDTILAPGDVIMLGDIQLATVHKAADQVQLNAHDTDLEIAPLEQTQPVYETTIVNDAQARADQLDETQAGPSAESGSVNDTGATIASDNSSLNGFAPHFKTDGHGVDGHDVNGVASGVSESAERSESGKMRFRGTPR